MTNPIVAELLARPELLAGASRPMTAAELRKTEAQLGFALPETLRDIYLHVANGGFGPHIRGFMGGEGGAMPDGDTSVSLYCSFRSDPDRLPWPDRLLPFFEWGCACRCLLDCTKSDGQVIYCEPGFFEAYGNDADPDSEIIFEDPRPGLFLDAPNLSEWLRRWLKGDLEMGPSGPLWIPPDEAQIISRRRGVRMED